ncbi:MAG: glucose-1-phosphate adenylyltransferase [Clostridia bacterium]|nr:glucose-1-phosphate adenylyltransferase [Clostridia bacterium]
MGNNKKECIAMLLAGGQGTRLGVLTTDVAKPAVPFGAKYRIIDFTLSNCVNSGIDTVGVLTQYRPFELHQYIGNGQPWDLDRLNGGVYVLPPFMRAKSGEWYKGTANAICQNIDFIDNYDPEYVVILSGDHIYKMDYAKMVEAHKANKAQCTIAVRKVPMTEAHRFGIMNMKSDGTIYEFEEKPKQPKSNNASMGIYVFTWKTLRKYLLDDDADPNSENDFGKNIIPNMLKDGNKMYGYDFEGYWKDVGTISSLWEANMDILHETEGLNLEDESWKVYARNQAEPPQFVGETGKIVDSLVSEGTIIEGSCRNSIISHSCKIGKGANVEGSIIMPGAVIEDGADVRYSIVGWNATIKKGAKVGETLPPSNPGEWEIAVVGPAVTIKENGVVAKGEMIG